jgi:radical SAM-linked protein
MTQMIRHRYRIHYAKREAIRFTSHLDLHRTWERTLRRARIPLAYSQGFNPRPKMNQSPALPLGCTSECEAVDIWLEEERVPDSILHDVEQVTPNGLQIHSVLEVDPRAPSLQSQTIATEYDVILDPPPPHNDLQRSVQAVLEAEKLLRHWRGKDYDLRSRIEFLEVSRQDDGRPILTMILSARPGATGRPEEVIASLGLDPAHARFHRTRLILDSD